MTHRMTGTVAAGARIGRDSVVDHRPERRARSIVAALAVSQTVGYGALYYSSTLLLSPLAGDLQTATTTITGAFTAATLVGAVTAVPVGRWLDRYGGRGLMTAGALGGSLLLAAMSQVHTVPQLYAVWIGIGLASAMSLYEAAFAVIVAWHHTPSARANALLGVTVVAGFASSIFLPLTGALIQAYGWRTGVLALAVVHGVLTVPLHAVVVRRPPHTTARHAAGRAGRTDARRRAVRAAVRDRYFWILAVAFVAHAAALSALTLHLVAYLVEIGHAPVFAASVAGLLGLLSVTGRLAVTGLQRRIRTTSVVAAVFGVQAVAAATLPLIGRTDLGAIIGVTGFGLGFGVATIARPALLAARYDTAGYATIAGLLTVPMTIAKAGAPLAAAALHTAMRGYTPVLMAIAIACFIAAAGIVAIPATPVPHGGKCDSSAAMVQDRVRLDQVLDAIDPSSA
jgi:predicted MFS family arabinose efflux permease